MSPEKGSMFYLSQRPYLVSGTLRDQLLYPFPPRAVWQGSSVGDRCALAARARAAPCPRAYSTARCVSTHPTKAHVSAPAKAQEDNSCKRGGMFGAWMGRRLVCSHCD